jgi:hypothetical protein
MCKYYILKLPHSEASLSLLYYLEQLPGIQPMIPYVQITRIERKYDDITNKTNKDRLCEQSEPQSYPGCHLGWINPVIASGA